MDPSVIFGHEAAGHPLQPSESDVLHVAVLSPVNRCHCRALVASALVASGRSFEDLRSL